MEYQLKFAIAGEDRPEASSCDSILALAIAASDEIVDNRADAKTTQNKASNGRAKTDGRVHPTQLRPAKRLARAATA